MVCIHISFYPVVYFDFSKSLVSLSFLLPPEVTFVQVHLVGSGCQQQATFQSCFAIIRDR